MVRHVFAVSPSASSKASTMRIGSRCGIRRVMWGYAVPGVMHLQAKKIEIETWPESRIEIDGEAVGNSPFCFELVPHGIRVVVGPGFVVPASM